jgi:MFS transporter, FSR family, fosmidomycin resistance protein
MTTKTKSLDKDSSTEFNTDQAVIISGAHFMHDTYTAFVAPLLPLLIEKLSLTLTMAGSLSALMQLPGLLNPFIGYLADKISLRYFVILAPAITASLISMIGLAPNYWSLAFIMVLTGISVAAFHAPAPAMIGRIAGKRVGAGMSIFMAGGELARTLGPLIAVWAVSIWGLEGIYRLMVIGWGTSLLLYWRLHTISGRPEKSGSLRQISPALIRFFLPLTLIVFFRLFLNVSLTTYLPTYMTQQGSDLKAAAFYLSWLEGAGVIGALLSGTISDRFGRKNVLLFAFSTSSLLMLIFLQINGFLLIPVLLMVGFTAISTGPVFLALVQDHLPNNRAIGNGVYLSISFLLRSLATLIIGYFGDHLGLESAFLGSAIISLLAVPWIFLLPKNNLVG